MQIEAVLFDLGDTLVDLGEGRGSYEARLLLRAGHVHDVLAGQGVPMTAVAVLAAWTVVLGLVGIWSYRRSGAKV